MNKKCYVLFITTMCIFAQHQDHMISTRQDLPSMSLQLHKKPSHTMMSDTHTMHGMYGRYIIERETSGTSWQPDSTPMIGIHKMHDQWFFMIHGFAMFIYDHQGGPRGNKKFFSENMTMMTAQRDLKVGTWAFRSMLSWCPLMGKKGYPLLLQTGETADGKTPLIDRQHPHDLFMELAVAYSLPITNNNSFFIYFGLPGEPALGPPFYQMRLSAQDNPEAPISHHWLDSTHISFGILTLGYVFNTMKIEYSFFTGREPDQHRFDIERPRFDSFSMRFSANPTKNIATQISYGYLKSPEQLKPNVDTQRITASLSYNKSWNDNNWQTMLAWGRNINQPGKTLDAFLIESDLYIQNKHVIFGRFENVAKDELFLEQDPLHDKVFNVNKLTLGYRYDFFCRHHIQWGIGFLGSILPFLSQTLDRIYDNPFSYMVFLNVRLR